MRKILFALLLLASSSFAVDTLTVPTDFNTVTAGTRANLSTNFTSIQTWGNKVRDTVAQVTARVTGYTGSLLVSSLSNLRLKVDADATETARLLVESGAGDSLFTVSEDSTSKFFGRLNGTTATFTGAISSVSPTFTGTLAAANGTYSGTLGVTGALTGAAATLTGNLSLLSSQDVLFADNAGTALTFKEGGNPYFRFVTTDGAEKISAFKAVDMSSTLAVAENVHTTGTGTGFWMNSLGVFSYGMYTTGTSLAFRSGSSTPFLTVTSGGLPTFANAVTMSSTLGVTGIQSNAEALAFTANGTAGTGRIYKSAGSGLTLRGVTGSSNDFGIESAAGSNILINPTGTTSITFPGANVTISGTATTTGVHTFTAAPVFSSVTASQILSVDASKNLTSTATTGSGSVTLATSPSITSPAVATSLTASYATASTAAEFDGSKNLVSVAKTGTGSDVYSNSPTLVTPALGAATATTIALGGNEAFDYDEGSFTGTMTGCTTSPTGTLYYTRVGKMVVLFIPSISATSNTTDLTITGAPAAITPARTMYSMPARFSDAGLTYEGTVSIAATGTLTASLSTVSGTHLVPSVFTASGAKGFFSSVITYTLQ